MLICEECGQHVRGMLAFRKHSFQHTRNLNKRLRNVSKIVPKTNGEEILVKSWTQKSRKKLRNSGQEYINSRAKVVTKKHVKPACTTCAFKCRDSFTATEREELFQSYWAMDYGAQRRFVHENVGEKKCHRSLTEGSRRKFTLAYSLLGRRVCKNFFCATLDISDRIVMVCKSKARQNIDVATDYRGSTKGTGRVRSVEKRPAASSLGEES